MTTITNIAQRVLDENNYTTGDISLTNLEYLIDNAIDTINLEVGTSIADLSGSAASKSLTGSESEVVAVKVRSALLLRAYKDKGPQVGIGTLNVTQITNDPHYDYFTKLDKMAISLLRGRSFERT